MSCEVERLVQFPVPALGLSCPACRHGLDGLPTDRCPECGEWIDLKSLIANALETDVRARRGAVRLLVAEKDPSVPVGEDLVAFFAASDQYTLAQAVEAALRVARQRQSGRPDSAEVPSSDDDWEARALAAEVGRPFFSGYELPVPDFGLTCERCGYPLRDLPRRVCPECGAEFDPARILGSEPTLQACTVDSEAEFLAATSTLAARRIPGMLQAGDPIGQLFQISLGKRGKWGRLVVPREFYFDALFWLRRAHRQDAAEPSCCEVEPDGEPAGASEWRCGQCGESVPADFAMCWNCCASRDT